MIFLHKESFELYDVLVVDTDADEIIECSIFRLSNGENEGTVNARHPSWIVFHSPSQKCPPVYEHDFLDHFEFIGWL